MLCQDLIVQVNSGRGLPAWYRRKVLSMGKVQELDRQELYRHNVRRITQPIIDGSVDRASGLGYRVAVSFKYTVPTQSGLARRTRGEVTFSACLSFHGIGSNLKYHRKTAPAQICSLGLTLCS